MARHLRLFFAFFLLYNANLLAQPWPNANWTTTGTCTGTEPEILKVFIDACYDPEDRNEFVYMKTGASGWDYSNFSINGGSGQVPNSLVTTATASNFQPAGANIINNLNAGLGACAAGPTFIAGTNPLPANATVMVYPCNLGTNVAAGNISYMCGKGPIYVIAGNFNPAGPPGQAFFRNGPPPGTSGTYKTEFLFGPCKKTLIHTTTTGSFPPNQGTGASSTGKGVAITGAGAVITSECFEAPACIGPPDPSISNPIIQICETSSIPAGVQFNCTNCSTGNISIYATPTSVYPIYVGPSFPNSSFFPPSVTTTYYVEQSAFCPSNKVPVTLQVNPAPLNTPTSPPTLTCASPTVTVSGAISTGANFTYNWTGPGGYTSNVAYPTLSALSTPPAQAGQYWLTVTNTTTGCSKTVYFDLTTNANFPIANAGADKVIDCNTPGPFLVGTAAVAGNTYAWSNGGTTAQQLVNTAGTYIVTVTNTANGCAKKDTMVVTQNNAAPTINPIAAVTVNCTTPSPTLNAVASGGTGLTYLWSNSGTNPTTSITTGGNYTVTVTNPSNGCKSTQSITISEDKVAPIATITPPGVLNCTNNSIVPIVTTGTSTGTNFTYNWTGPSSGYPSTAVTPPNATVIGSYAVTVTNTTNGCTKTASVSVTENKTIPPADAGADKVLNCINNQSVSIGTAAVTGLNYSWSNASTTATTTITTPGTYTLTVTDPVNGCKKIDDVTVTLDNIAPSISPIPPVTVNCFTPTPVLNTTVTGSNLVYAWSPSGSGPNPTITTGNLTYTVTVTNSVNGCKDVKSILVPEDKADPTATIAPIGILTCANNSLLPINSTGTSTGANFTYNWTGPSPGYPSTAITPPSATVAGTYNLTVTNTTNGCTKTATSTVTENKTLPTADAGPDKVLNCINNQSVSIGTAATGGFTYLWSNAGITSATQTVTTAGTYTVTVTDPVNGCKKVDDVTVTADIIAPVMSAIPAVTVNCFTPNPVLNTTTTGSNLVYTWTPSGSGANPTITTGGTYNVTVTNSVNGCKDTKSIVVPEDKVDPNAVIAAPPVLTCTNNSNIVLNATGTSTGANFTYNWTGPGGYASTSIPPTAATAPGTYNLTVTNTTNGCTKTVSVPVTQNITQPTLANMAPQTLTCTNNGQVTIGGAATGGGTNFTYNWSNSSTTATQTVTAPGTFTVTVTNTDNGCTKTSSVVIDENKTIPTVNAGVDLSINCTSPTISTTATASTTGTGPLTYAWSSAQSGGTTLTPTFNAGGTYTLTVTDSSNGCKKTDDIVVTADFVEPTATIATPGIISCTNTSVSLSTAGSSTGANYTYSWTGPSGFSNSTPNPSVTTAGSYNLTITNTVNGCKKVASVTVNEDKVAPNASVSSAPILTCANPTIQINATGSTGANFSYNWVASGGGTITGGATSLTPTINSAGTYSLTVTNSTNGCTKTAQVTVTEDKVAPVATATGSGAITCIATSLNLGVTVTSGSNLQYQWTASAGGNIVGNPNQKDIVVNQGGTYTVTVTNTVNGCTVVSSTSTTANNTLPIANATASSAIDCNNTSATIDGSTSSTGATYTYVWTGPGGFTNSTSLTPSVTVGGAYTISITNTSNGCVNSKTIIVSENKTPPSATINTPGSITCTSPTATISATGSNSFLYNWAASAGGSISGSSSGQNITVSSVGTYTLTVINSLNGCQATYSTSVAENKVLPTVTIAPATAISCVSPTITLNANGSSTGGVYQIVWSASGGGTIVNGSTSLQPTVSSAGTYTLQINDLSNGCTKSQAVTVTDNKVLPIAQVAAVNGITCLVNSQNLDGTGSSTGGNFSYQWQASGGGIVASGQNTLQATTNVGGTYTLVVTDITSSCSASKTVIIPQNTTKPNANAGPNKTITCTASSVTLQGSGSSGGQYQYQWSNTGGNIQISSGGNTFTPTVTQTGQYFLKVTDTSNGCTEVSSTNVSLDQGVPTVNAGTKKEINCTTTQVTLDGTGSSSGAGFTFNWTTNNGAFLSGQTTLTPIAIQAGTYTLEVTNTNNSCKGTAQVQVEDNRIKPTLKIAKPKALNCATANTVLNGTGSSAGTNITYLWTTTNGNIVAGTANTVSATVDKAGVYNLKIKNSQNGCEKDSSVTVNENFNKPAVTVAPPSLLTCTQPNTILDASASTKTQNAKIQWKSSVANGIVSGGNTLKPTVGDAGKYTLILTDTLSFCKDSVSVDVVKDANIPQANAGATGELNCTVKNITLAGTASTGGNITYTWTTTGGNISSGANTLTPTVNKAGKYTLKVVNSTNQCIKESSVDITQDTLKPIAKISKPAILNCKTTVTTLDASASSQGANITFTWTPPTGVSFVGGGTTSTPTINKPGIYVINIENTKNTCKASNSVTIDQDIAKPQVSIVNTDTLNCRNASVKLKGTASANSGFYTFEWKDPAGGIFKDKNTLSPSANKDGNYQLVVTDTVNFCPTTAQLTVIKDIQTPSVSAGKGGNLTCTVKDLILTGTASTGNNFTYTWTTSKGNIVGATNGLSIKTDAPGKYFLEVENKINGCKAKDSTVVSQDSNVPKVEILTNGNLDCKTQSLILDGSGSSQGPGITFTWSTKNGGKITAGSNTLKATASSAGVYILQITNSNNNCVKEIEKTINMDTIRPVINIAQDIITCAKPTIELSGKIFQANKFTFTWQTSAGNITSKKDSLQIQVNKKGIYTLKVKNSDNECENSKDVNVLEDKILPLTDAGPAFEINCQDSIITLQGDKSSKGTEFVYNWTTNTGFIISGEKTTTPKINKDGAYYLSIFNKSNGCSNKDTVDIKINKKIPQITLVKPDTLTCKKQQVNLVANTIVTGVAQYAWSVASGNLLGDKTKATVSSDQPGTYNLQVIDDKNKCVSKATVSVVQDTIKPKVSAGANIELNCKNPTIDVTGTATAAQAVTYNWTTTNGTIVANADKAKVTVKSAGFYKLQVTNKFNGCSANDEMEVTFLGAPKAVILPPQTLTCTRLSVVLDSKGSDSGANYTYTWSDTNGNSLGSSPTLNITQSGTYNFKVYNNNNECEKKEQVTVTQDIAKPNADAGSAGVIDCDKGFVVISAKNSSQGSKYAYSWTGGLIESGANTQEAKVTAQAIYTLLVTNSENGCTASDTVSVLSLKPALLKSVANDPLCFGGKGSILLDKVSGGTPPYTYSIDGGKNYKSTNLFSGLKPGEYKTFVQDSKGCEDSSSVILNTPEKLTLDIPAINKVKIGEDIQLNVTVNPSVPALKSITWSPDSMLSCKKCLTPTIAKPLKNIYFTIKVVNENGCVAETFTNVDVDKGIDIYVPSSFSPNGDNNNDRFTIFGDPNLILSIKWLRIFDRWGDTIFEETDIKPNDTTRGWDGNFKNSPVNPGVFIWNCEVIFLDGRTKVLKGDVTVHK
jgi:gliding motility-associated-like protein